MSDEARVRELLAPLVARPIDLEGRQFRVDREAALSNILKASQAGYPRSRRPSRLVVLGLGVAAGLALAASALLFVGRRGNPPAAAASSTVQDVSGVVAHWQAGASRVVVPKREPQVITSSGELSTEAASSARIRNTRGAEVALFENSRLGLSGFNRPSSSVELMTGSIRCEVPKLGAGERFSVVTPRAHVEVRGTAFTVQVSGAAESSRTCVKVEHGVVVVQTSASESRVEAGQSWGCEPERRSAPQPGSLEPPPPKPPRTNPIERGNDKAGAGTLDEENRLFQAGLAAERQRDLTAARAAFEQLLTRFPSSPLADDARAARARVLQAQAPRR